MSLRINPRIFISNGRPILPISKSLAGAGITLLLSWMISLVILFPYDLRIKIAEFVDYYNNKRYHESLGNLTPADVYFGRDQQVKVRRQEIKMKTLKERRKINRKISA